MQAIRVALGKVRARARAMEAARLETAGVGGVVADELAKKEGLGACAMLLPPRLQQT